jgi:hypothetical protein
MVYAWLLNLDADLELRRPLGYAPPRAFIERTETLVNAIEGLVRPEDTRVDPNAPRAPTGAEGRAWCPTPRALSILSASGAALPDAPSLEVLRRVNHRRFSAELGQQLDGGRFVNDLDELIACIGAPVDSGCWVLKRPHGFSGMGHRRVPVGALDHKAAPWVDASLKEDGLQVEPWVERIADFAIHGFLSPAGEVTIGQPCVQRCDAKGVWLHTERATEGALHDQERQMLVADTRRSADALAVAGYFGPFGIDAFRYRSDGAERFNVRSEINARYTMGWAVGMMSRPDL